MDRKRKKNFNLVILALLIFSFVSWMTSYYFDTTTGKPLVKMINESDNLLGPIEIKHPKAAYRLTVSQNIPPIGGVWSYVTGEVLDSEKEYLYSFGDEFWYESGSDSDGVWKETKNNYRQKMTFREKGTFYFKFLIERSPLGDGDVTVSFVRLKGSSVYHYVCFVVGLVLALILATITHWDKFVEFNNN